MWDERVLGPDGEEGVTGGGESARYWVFCLESGKTDGNSEEDQTGTTGSEESGL